MVGTRQVFVALCLVAFLSLGGGAHKHGRKTFARHAQTYDVSCDPTCDTADEIVDVWQSTRLPYWITSIAQVPAGMPHMLNYYKPVVEDAFEAADLRGTDRPVFIIGLGMNFFRKWEPTNSWCCPAETGCTSPNICDTVQGNVTTCQTGDKQGQRCERDTTTGESVPDTFCGVGVTCGDSSEIFDENNYIMRVTNAERATSIANHWDCSADGSNDPLDDPTRHDDGDTRLDWPATRAYDDLDAGTVITLYGSGYNNSPSCLNSVARFRTLSIPLDISTAAARAWIAKWHVARIEDFGISTNDRFIAMVGGKSGYFAHWDGGDITTGGNHDLCQDTSLFSTWWGGALYNFGTPTTCHGLFDNTPYALGEYERYYALYIDALHTEMVNAGYDDTEFQIGIYSVFYHIRRAHHISSYVYHDRPWFIGEGTLESWFD